MKEEDIRPQDIFDKYLLLAQQDTAIYFSESPREDIACPACGGEGEVSFVKQGFSYKECPRCQTLFVSPRPAAEAFSRYYQESESVRFWATTFYKKTEEARREKLWRPKVKLINELLVRSGLTHYNLIDIGGGYGIFAEEYEKIFHKQVSVIEPGPALARICREKGLKVIQSFLEDIQPKQIGDGPNVYVSFELFEHLHSPEQFLRCLYNLMSGGDMFLFTTLSGAGVDIQALWEYSKSLSPPHHLNFLNPRAINLLLRKVGLDVIEVSTPGKLDIDILCNNVNMIKDRFWRTFILQASEEEKHAMQAFLSSHGLSSHMLVTCRKP